MPIDDDLRRRREERCLGHMNAENAHAFDEAIAFFDRPRYEVVPTGEVYDGRDRLNDLMLENVTAFPDFRFDVAAMHHADEAIIVEGTFRGTHLGVWRGLPATGRRVSFPMLIVFPFDGDRMLGERLFFDLATALRQLGVARDPGTVPGKIETLVTHPITLGRALVRRAAVRGTAASLPPGSMGMPIIGETPAFLRSPFRFLEDRQRRFGDVFKSRVLFRRVVFLAGIEGANAFYNDEAITRTDAHPFPLVDLFGGDNMEMLDGDAHLALKRATLAAFDHAAFERYIPELQAPIDRTLARITARNGAPVIKDLQRLAIEAIWTNVLGPPGEAASAISRDYAAIITGLTSLPVPIPGTPYGRARAARDRLLARIAAAIDDRRAAPTDDGLSRILTAHPEMTNRQAQLEVHHFVIAGFIVYLLMGEVIRRLAEDPQLFERCRNEIVGAGVPELTLDALANLPTCTSVVQEAKRIVPLVPLAFGRARRSFRCGGYDVPAGWTVYLALHLNNHDPRVFRSPDAFDPDRFSAARAEDRRDPMAFIPQGAPPPIGHQCLGLTYSTLLVLAFMHRLLTGYRWTLPAQDLEPDARKVPPEPRDGLRLLLHRA
jgi:retinoid hydroxylase